MMLVGWQNGSAHLVFAAVVLEWVEEVAEVGEVAAVEFAMVLGPG